MKTNKSRKGSVRMSDSMRNKKSRHFRHITEKERYTIETMLKLGKNPREIAEEALYTQKSRGVQ